jgi:DNA-binding PadR family transcriptional regulator
MNDRVNREILLAFWKTHVLHHAESGPVYGLWLLEELGRHGHRLSPGTLYPMLARMERNGWLRSQPGEHGNARKNYRITPVGRRVLGRLRQSIVELHEEIVDRAGPRRRARPKEKPR